MKILILHGYDQSLERIMKTTSNLKKLLVKEYNAQIFYCEAPNDATSNNATDFSTDQSFGKAWFTSDNNDFFTTTHYQNLDQSLEKLNKFISTYGPFDTLIGFSQGAVMAMILLQLYQFKFAIIISSYAVTDIKYNDYTQIKAPTLHIWGANDSVILPEQSVENYKKCHLAEYYIHQGKHVVPSTSQFKTALRSFIDKYK